MNDCDRDLLVEIISESGMSMYECRLSRLLEGEARPEERAYLLTVRDRYYDEKWERDIIAQQIETLSLGVS